MESKYSYFTKITFVVLFDGLKEIFSSVRGLFFASILDAIERRKR